MGEYDSVFGSGQEETEDLVDVRRRFEEASRPFLASAWTWLSWGLLLPGATFATWLYRGRWQPLDVLLLWSVTILLGGLVEGFFLLRQRVGTSRSSLTGWVLGVQGNLSLVAIALSALAVGFGHSEWLAGIWLLLLGHSFYVVGGLCFRPMRTTGVIFELAGVGALVPATESLLFLGLGTSLGALWMALGIWRSQRTERAANLGQPL